MPQTQLQLIEKFKPLLGQRPKRARVGYGSFLTLDFGQASRKDHRLWYEWQIWIQQTDWQLLREKPNSLVVTDSEAKRGPMQAAIARLETKTLERVDHRVEGPETRFVFSGGVELVCKPYADGTEREDCWALYTPDAYVLKADSGGRLRYFRSDIPERNRAESRQGSTTITV